MIEEHVCISMIKQMDCISVFTLFQNLSETNLYDSDLTYGIFSDYVSSQERDERVKLKQFSRFSGFSIKRARPSFEKHNWLTQCNSGCNFVSSFV